MNGNSKPGSASAVPGLVVAAGMLTGTAGLILSIIALFGGQEIGAGLFMLAAALAFGLMANAVFRA